MESVLFKPKYSFYRVQLGLILAFIIGVVIVVTSFNHIGYLLFGCLLCFSGLYGARTYPQEILFQQNTMVVKNWLFPHQTFEYRNVNIVNGRLITLGKNSWIPLLNMENADELIIVTNSFISSRSSSDNLVSQEAQVADLRSQSKKLKWMSYFVVGFTIMFGLVDGFSGGSIDIRWFIAGLAIIVVVSIILISRRKQR